MSVISSTAVFTVPTHALREEVNAARKELAHRMQRRHNDRREMISLLRTDDPMMDQAAEENDDVRDIEDDIAKLRRRDGELVRLLQMIKLHLRDQIEVSHDLLDGILVLANEAVEAEAVAA